MSSSLFLDASTATWLAALDPALAHLLPALPRDSAGSRWTLHDVRWSPGQGCRLAYRVQSPPSAATFVAVDVTGSGWSRNDYREDASLPGLSRASEPSLVSGRLSGSLDEPIRHCRVEPVRYRPGSRCVLRYDVETAAGTRRFYAKVFRPDRFAEISQRGIALAEAAHDSGLVPELSAVWPDLQVMVAEAVHGTLVSAIVGDPRVPAGHRARVAFRLGGLLARFHSQGDVAAGSWSATQQVAALSQSMEAVRASDPLLADRMSATMDVLAVRVPPAGIEVLGHGGFRVGQVIQSDDDRLIVLDTDGLCRSDPGRDLGAVQAHLMWHGVREPGERPTLRGAERALLSGYEADAGPVDPEALLWWRAAGLLQVASRRYRRLETGHWPFVPALVDAAAELLATYQSHTAPGGAIDLLNIGQMAQVLHLALGRGDHADEPLTVDSAERLVAVPGRRSVVRYSVRGIERGHPVSVVGKTFAEPRRARLLYDHLCVLHGGPFRSGELRVPEPVALLPEHRMVLYRHCVGTPLDRVLATTRSSERAVRLAARWLARLHSSDVRLPRAFSLEQEEVSTRRWAALIGNIHPSLAPHAHALADRWVSVARSAEHADEVPIHKDFHPGHVLVGDAVFVLDLDEARNGDPAFDVAHFFSYLGLRDPDSSVGTARAAFLDEYAAATGWVDKGTFAPFSAYTWLKIAKQCAVGSGPYRGAPAARRLAEAERALAKGQQCLSE